MRQVPVLVVGGGPVGMTLALELAGRGVACTLAERNPTTTRHPKMDITNARSMELFRRLGLVPALRAAAVPEAHPFDVSWVTSMVGHELHRFRYASVDAAWDRIRARNDGSQPGEAPMRVSQVEIEPVLKRAVDASPLVDVRFGVAFEELSQDSEGVTATLRSADGTVETLRCAYLVGCDGGTSRVRACLDIALSGEARIMQRFMTHFHSDARDVLQRWGVAWHYQSPRGTLIAQNDRDVWTLHSRLPDGTDLAAVDPSALLRGFLGRDIPHRVVVANPWTPHLLVADSYGTGRVLLAGDAAHQYIPTGGYGMNTGIGDACDLGWKLAAVLQGFGGPTLLDAYEAERRPVGLRNREGSRSHNGTRGAIAALYGPALEAEGPEGDAARAEAGARIAAIGNAENESFGIEFGYAYPDSFIVCTDPAERPPDDPRRYEPSTVPGVRLPSVLLQDGTPIFDRLGPWFTLVTTGSQDVQALTAAASRHGMPLQVLRLEEPHLADLYGEQALLVRPDQHIAWRGPEPDAERAESIVLRVLGHQAGAAGARALMAAASK
ncbi:2-polyprenyl-6-methoxyphenol hydroxylase [Roseomonas rosea]|uniref:2-polyprenyl-6-methoxyphenol hydroxylase n=1 Tax=Muricoccus roseus TaxID=198092 RepID=A0A1M6PTG3_9PROT|nr:FAD-dependent monooxygenase [Roseomonas rosea]SHK11186.1 2-polyprenyl-6-methoxyphenol hydroxylase [Roseomonas rosea]